MIHVLARDFHTLHFLLLVLLIFEFGGLFLNFSMYLCCFCCFLMFILYHIRVSPHPNPVWFQIHWPCIYLGCILRWMHSHSNFTLMIALQRNEVLVVSLAWILWSSCLYLVMYFFSLSFLFACYCCFFFKKNK